MYNPIYKCITYVHLIKIFQYYFLLISIFIKNNLYIELLIIIQGKIF